MSAYKYHHTYLQDKTKAEKKRLKTRQIQEKEALVLPQPNTPPPEIVDDHELLLSKRTAELLRLLRDRGLNMDMFKNASQRDLREVLMSGQALKIQWGLDEPEDSEDSEDSEEDAYRPLKRVIQPRYRGSRYGKKPWCFYHSAEIAALGPVYMTIPTDAPKKGQILTLYVHTQHLNHVLQEIQKHDGLTLMEGTQSSKMIPRFRQFLQKWPTMVLVTEKARPNRFLKEDGKRRAAQFRPRPANRIYSDQDRGNLYTALRRATKPDLVNAILACPTNVRKVILRRIKQK